MKETADQVVPGKRAYSTVFAAARELGYSELEAMCYATNPDLFVAENPDWDLDVASEDSPENPDQVNEESADSAFCRRARVPNELCCE